MNKIRNGVVLHLGRGSMTLLTTLELALMSLVSSTVVVRILENSMKLLRPSVCHKIWNRLDYVLLRGLASLHLSCFVVLACCGTLALSE